MSPEALPHFIRERETSPTFQMPRALINNANLGKVRWHNLLAALLGICLTAGIGMSQVRSSAITGIVTDASGAAVPNATLIVTNVLTNVTYPSKTNSAGEYTVPYLPEGNYSVTVTAQGFQTYVKTGIVLETATTLRVDAALAVGTVSTTVEVKASAAAVQTENGTVHGTVTAQIIDSIPDINRNPLLYAGLVAGVVPEPGTKSADVLGVGHNDREELSMVRINGAILGSDDITLDGVSVQGAGWHEMAVMPDTDALQEVRVTPNTFTAETGDAQGVIAMTTKSGANQFHGDLYYYLRNEALDANGMYNDLYGIAKPAYRLNQGGGGVGGPVIIPHLYNGKDKMFFFGSFMRLAHSAPATLVGTVPTDLQRVGDFSKTMIAGINGQPEPINLYNPFLATPYNGSSTVVQRPIYTGAMIPAAGSGPGSVDPYGEKLLQAYPEPNATPTDAFGDNNYRFNGTTPEYRNAFAARWDYRLGQKNSLYATSGFSIGAITPPNLWGSSNKFDYLPQGAGIVSDHNPYGSLGDVYTLNPTTVIDLHYGFTRVHGVSGYPSSGWTSSTYTQYGLPSTLLPLIDAYGEPMSVADGSWDWGGPINMLNNDSWTHKNEHQDNHDIAGNLAKVAGRWTFKAGGEYRVYLSNWQDLEQSTPVLNTAASGNAGASTAQYANISGSGSSLNIDPDQQGIPFADLLTGVEGFALTPGCATVLALAAKYFALYSQNDWKATSKLTVNLGLRWEVQPGPTERFNRLADINLNAANPYAAGANLSNPLGGMGMIDFMGTTGEPRNMWNTQWGNFSPRLGAAYQISHDTVLRGGYGRSYYASNTGFNANGLIYGQTPFSPGAEAIPYGLTPNGVPIGTFDQPQNTLVFGGLGAVQSPYIYGNAQGGCCGWFPRNHPNAHVDQWNFFVERRFGQGWTLSAGYVASHASDIIWRGFELNGVFNVPNSTLMAYKAGWIASNGTQDPAQVQVANPLPAFIGLAAGPIGNTTIPAIDTQMPYLALLGDTIQGNAGYTNYNALQVTLRHTFSSGLTVLANYTWSKATGLTGGVGGTSFEESEATSWGGTNYSSGGVDYGNLNNNRGLQSYDIPQRIVATAVYRLPFNKGQKLAPSNNFARALTSGWQLAPVVTLQSGGPWAPSCGGEEDGRCNIVPNEPMYVPKSLQHWYNGATSVTLPDGRSITPPAFTRLLYNPDRYTAPLDEFPNGTYAEDQYFEGDTSMYQPGLHGPMMANVDLSLQREIQIHERLRLSLRADATNAFNRTNFWPTAVQGGGGVVTTPGPSLGLNSSITTGSLQAQFYDPRMITLSLYLKF